ncbi:hypothetical protein HG437_004100 [Candidatus Saccharibacteria bacterium]|nr:hypothetical protein [Candidatus Saccharibacteria bacterium]
MGKNSRKRKTDRKNIRQVRAIEQQVKESSDKLMAGRLPSSVALNSSISEESTDIYNYHLIFDYYNQSMCELHKLNNKSKCKNLIKQLQQISQSKTLPQGLVYKKIKNSGNYTKLYDNIPEDATILETRLSKGSRLFLFTLSSTISYNGMLIPQNYCCIVSIIENHIKY